MRKKHSQQSSKYRILLVDDETGIIDSLSAVLNRNGYNFESTTDPLEAVEKIRNENFDLLILDYMMEPICGDEVVKRIREFDQELYILLLTGYKDLAPPLDTIRELAIQGYCEKGDKFDQLVLLIESGIKSISQMRMIKRFQDGLNKILQAVPKIYQLQPISNILEEILKELMQFVNSENAFILFDDIIHSDSGNKSIFKGIGEYDKEIEDFMEMLPYDLIENIGYARSTKKVVDIDQGVIFPLLNEYQDAIGVMFVESHDFKEGIELLEIFANQAATSLNNAFLHSLVNVKKEELNKTYEELKDTYMDTIEALRMAVDAKDVYTRGHSDRVAYYASQIGKAFGLKEGPVELLRIGGVFHDVGKIGTADDILLKTSKLDDKEYLEIKRHPIKGANILSALSLFKDAVPLVRYHHERIDGRGYPDGLQGDEIPFLARIIAVADAFDAMTSDRQYRSKLGLQQAKDQLIKGAGTQFDKEVVDKFIKLLDNFDQMQEEIAYTFESAGEE